MTADRKCIKDKFCARTLYYGFVCTRLVMKVIHIEGVEDNNSELNSGAIYVNFAFRLERSSKCQSKKLQLIWKSAQINLNFSQLRISTNPLYVPYTYIDVFCCVGFVFE